MKKHIPYTQAFLRKRKFLVVLPLLVLPFLTLGFWTLGGGKKAFTTGTPLPAGLNTHLPEARNKEENGSDKLALYEQADKEAARQRQDQRPFFSLDTVAITPSPDSTVAKGQPPSSSYDPAPPDGSPEAAEARLYQKLADVNRQLQANTSTQQPPTAPLPHADAAAQTIVMANRNRLEEINSLKRTNNQEADPELGQLNAMMDKILAIQHPERVQEKIQTQSKTQHRRVFTVTAPKQTDNITLLTYKRSPDATFSLTEKQQATELHNDFYTLPEDSLPMQAATGIEAVVDHTQTLVSGATIRLRLCHDVYINKVLIPKDQVLYGLTALTGERLQVHIPSILYQNKVLPVDLSVYDLDGLEGIFVPGTVTRDAARVASENWVQGIDLLPGNRSLASQATTASIEAAKTLFSKKARLVWVTVKAGYRVLLQDNKQQDFSSY